MKTLFQPQDPLLSPLETAAYLNVSKQTLAMWRSTGRYRLPFVKVGRMVRYRKSDLDALLVRYSTGITQQASLKVLPNYQTENKAIKLALKK